MKKVCVLIFLAITMFSILSGCSKINSEEILDDSQQKCVIVQNEMRKALEQAYNEAGEPENVGGEIAQLLFERTKYTVLSVNEDSCVLEVTYIDVENVWGELTKRLQSNCTEEETITADSFLTSLLEALGDETVPTHTVEIKTVLRDGVPEFNEELENAFLGGVLNLYSNEVLTYFNEYTKSEVG